MAEAAIRESATVAGRPDRARVARTFVGGVLGLGHPCGDVAALLVSELFGNSVRYSRSGDPGETVTVAVRDGGGIVRVEVADRSAPGVPELRLADGDAEGGRGLGLVTALAEFSGGYGQDRSHDKSRPSRLCLQLRSTEP
jgi:anti-sigma regulatory factor (Ser/Thr protein kinase)